MEQRFPDNRKRKAGFVATVATLVKPLTQPPYSEYEDTAKLNWGNFGNTSQSDNVEEKKRTSVGLEKRRDEKRRQFFSLTFNCKAVFMGFKKSLFTQATSGGHMSAQQTPK